MCKKITYNRVKELRQFYGLSQAELAILLSVNLSLRGMVKTGKRELPTAAPLKLNPGKVHTYNATTSDSVKANRPAEERS